MKTTDTIIDTFDGGYAETLRTYAGEIVECTVRRVGTTYRYAVTSLILYNVHHPVTGKKPVALGGYRLLTVALPAGILLYNYINSSQRRTRMDKIVFEFQVHEERQHIKGYKAYDPDGWVGEALKMENTFPRC